MARHRKPARWRYATSLALCVVAGLVCALTITYIVVKHNAAKPDPDCPPGQHSEVAQKEVQYEVNGQPRIRIQQYMTCKENQK